MQQDAHRNIRQMSADQLEQALTARPGTRGVVSNERELREFFGDEEFESLQRLAQHAVRTRSRAPIKGNIVFLPGIMGSELTTTSGGDDDVVWTNYFRLVFGAVERLQLTADGRRQTDIAYQVRPSALDRRTYARTITWLRANWNVVEFPFDWRLDIDRSSNALAELIRRQFNGQPVHLVAHSMGGLVSRNFVRLHQDLWQSMRDANLTRGGRLVMLGTPNYGSFSIPQVFTGAENLLRLLERADVTHNMAELLEIINSFVGSYQMLPAPSKIPTSMQVIYRRDAWGRFPVSEAHLNRAFQFHFDLEDPVSISSERMTYIAGCNRETLSGLQMIAPGEFTYTTTTAGDGRVPHALGLLPDVSTYYIEETHGDLPRNEQLLAALEEILERGRTSALATQPPAARSITAEGQPWKRSATDNQSAVRIEQISRQTEQKNVMPDQVREAEETLQRAALGRDPLTTPAAPQASKVRVQLRATKPFRLKVEVVQGDVTRIQGPLVVVGRYSGTRPLAALGALDRALDFWITRASEHGMIGSRLGELFFIPVPPGTIGAKAVMLAGMGDAGRFTREELQYLMTNVIHAASGLNLEQMATVLIGGGTGGLSRERALRAMLGGVVDAFTRLKPDQRIQRLSIVENDATACREITELLRELQQKRTLPTLALEITNRRLPTRGHRAAVAARPEDLSEEDGPRITIERQDDRFRFSALMPDAVVPMREVPVQLRLANGVAERLMNSDGREEQEKYGRLLHSYLLPEDFQALIAEGGPLTLVLDPSTAAFPWEMACFNATQGPVFLGPDLSLTRQFRTTLSAAPGIAPPMNHQLKALVIADPAPEAALQLPGARREGREVVRVLNEFKNQNGIQLEIVSRIGSEECDPVELLALILTEDFDIVHFAGHGVFDPEDTAQRGWVFGQDLIFSAREIFRARRVPRLVFANACFSAVVQPGTTAAQSMTRQLAGLAEAFFERGVQNYLGSGWPVDDEGAVAFAGRFYRELLAGETLGDAVSRARLDIMNCGSTWGAYQHYGQAGAKIILPMAGPIRRPKRIEPAKVAKGTGRRLRRPQPAGAAAQTTRARVRRLTTAKDQIQVLGIPTPKSLLSDSEKRASGKKP